MDSEERKNVTVRLSRQSHRRLKVLTVVLDCDNNALFETLLQDKSAALGVEDLMQTRNDHVDIVEPQSYDT